MKKDRTDHARGWMLKGDSDLADAHRTLESSGPYDTACFHAQQAAEKYCKAFLAAWEQPIPRTHDLGSLWETCLRVDPSFPETEPVMEVLNRYGVASRYDLEFWPDLQIAEEAVQMAGRVRDRVRARFPFSIG